MVGGYKMISLNDVNIIPNGDAVTIKGIYEKIEHNYRKPVLLGGLTINGVERADRYITFSVDDSDFVGFIVLTNWDALEIRIKSDDSVTISNS